MLPIINNPQGFYPRIFYRNCENCIYKLSCPRYTPSYNFLKQEQAVYNHAPQTPIIQHESKQYVGKDLIQENMSLKRQIEELNQYSQDLQFQIDNMSKIQEVKEQEAQKEQNKQLAVAQEKSLEIYGNKDDMAPLKMKKGLFGTKYVEDKKSKK